VPSRDKRNKKVRAAGSAAPSQPNSQPPARPTGNLPTRLPGRRPGGEPPAATGLAATGPAATGPAATGPAGPGRSRFAAGGRRLGGPAGGPAAGRPVAGPGGGASPGELPPGGAFGRGPIGGGPIGGAALGATAPEAKGPQRRFRPAWRSLKNWRVRSRLLLLIIIPTLTAVVLGGVYIVASVQSAVADQHVETLASLSSDITNLATNLENERDQTLEYIGLGAAGRAGTLENNSANNLANDPAANLQQVTTEQSLTKPWISRVETDSKAIGAGYPAEVQTAAEDIPSLLSLIPAYRTAALTTDMPPVDVVQKYTDVITQLLDIDNDISIGSGDATLNNDVRSLNLVSLIAEEVSQQRGLLAFAFAQDGTFNPSVLAAVQTAQEEQNANQQEYNRVATAQQVNLYNNTVSGPLVDEANLQELQAVQDGVDHVKLDITPTTANEWYGNMTTGTLTDIQNVQQDLVAATTARASKLHRDAIITAVIIGAAVLLVLLLALLLTTLVGRSMVRPLRRLRSGALEVAGVRLPDTVRRMSDTDGAGVLLDIEPIDVDSSDEIGEVARAFDQVHREALRLAANEAALRGNVNAMFVNLSRRSQSLVERQIKLIDDLEQGEQDADRLASLFQMDHLATRMRRNSENLLVLAGHDASRRWNQPVALVDVLRAAVSEIEQYERVTLNVQPGIAVRGHAVNDVVHLLAELAENATSFSSAETPVVVAGHLLSSGGVLLDITDQGVGMGAEEMAHANWRLDNPPVVDVAVSRRMGLFVVARLAARHGIRVRLRPATAGGLTALVWLPDEVISHDAEIGADAPGLRRFELPAPGAATAAGAGGMPALVGGLNGGGAGAPSAEDEINAARAPRFASLQAEAGSGTNDKGLGPRRVPGAGLHPGNVGWGGAATTSPLPAFGSDAAEAELATASGQAPEFNGDSRHQDDVAGVGPSPAAGLAGPAVEFGGAAQPGSPVQPLTLGQPSVVGSASGADDHDAAAAMPSGRPTTGSRATLASSVTGVVIPPAEHVATENRLPIFEAVESDWFRRGRTSVPAAAPAGAGGFGGPAGSADDLGGQQDGFGSPGRVGGSSRPAPAAVSGGYGDGSFGAGTAAGWPPSSGGGASEPQVTWAASAADQGWEAAAAAAAPSTGGTTTAGLPKRVPQANLIPGTAAPEPVMPAPVRSAASTRERFASFQRGIREGRAAASGDEAHSDGDSGS
jgi:signal transduction histidine kinase